MGILTLKVVLYLSITGHYVEEICISVWNVFNLRSVLSYSTFFFINTVQTQTLIYTRIHSPLWTHTRTTYPMSTHGRPSRRIGSWNWGSHHRRLAVDGNIASHWMNISIFIRHSDVKLGFEIWWVGGTTTLLTTQSQIGSTCQIVLKSTTKDSCTKKDDQYYFC